MMQSHRRFTLVEILVAMAIILVLLGLTVGTTLSHRRAMQTRTSSRLNQLEIALQMYHLQWGHFPQSPQPRLVDWSADSFVTPNGHPCLDGYTPEGFTDSWARPFRYQCPGVMNDVSFDLWSLGPDGAPGAAGVDDDGDGTVDEDGTAQPAQNYRSDSQHPNADLSDDIANWKRNS